MFQPSKDTGGSVVLGDDGCADGTKPCFREVKKIRRGYLRRFHRTVHAVDSTTIQLVANYTAPHKSSG